MTKELLFSVTKDDFEMQTFKAGGKGGQAQNKNNTGVRLIHRDSGAVGEARDSRSQHQNKKAAFERLIATEKFQNWYRIECARRLGNQAEIKRRERAAQNIDPDDLLVEIKENGKWVPE